MKLLDTTFLAHYYRGDARAESFLSEHEQRGADLFTTAVNLEEIAVGFHLVEDEPAMAELLADFGWLEVVPFDSADAYHAGALEAELQADDEINQGRLNALTGDLLIAGAAINRDATVVTENVEDFEALDCAVETY